MSFHDFWLRLAQQLFRRRFLRHAFRIAFGDAGAWPLTLTSITNFGSCAGPECSTTFILRVGASLGLRPFCSAVLESAGVSSIAIIFLPITDGIKADATFNPPSIYKRPAMLPAHRQCRDVFALAAGFFAPREAQIFAQSDFNGDGAQGFAVHQGGVAFGKLAFARLWVFFIQPFGRSPEPNTRSPRNSSLS